MAKILVILSTLFYWLIAARIFRAWLKFFNKDTSLADSDKLPSLVLLACAIILWPIVVPFAYLELLNKKKDCS